MRKQVFLIFKKGIRISLIWFTLVYFNLRIVLIIMTLGFHYVFYSQSLNLNLAKAAFSTDIMFAFLLCFISLVYFRKRLLIFISLMFLIFSISVFRFLPYATKQFEVIEHTSFKENHLTYKSLFSTNADNWVNATFSVYKEVFPLTYKQIGYKEDVYRRISLNSTTPQIKPSSIFKANGFEVSEDGKTMYYGPVEIPLE